MSEQKDVHAGGQLLHGDARNSRSQVSGVQLAQSRGGFLPEEQLHLGYQREASVDNSGLQLPGMADGALERPIISQGFQRLDVAGSGSRVEEPNALEQLARHRLHMKNIQNLKSVQTKLEKQHRGGFKQRLGVHGHRRFLNLNDSPDLTKSAYLQPLKDVHHPVKEQQEDLVKATAALAAIRQKKDY